MRKLALLVLATPGTVALGKLALLVLVAAAPAGVARAADAPPLAAPPATAAGPDRCATAELTPDGTLMLPSQAVTFEGAKLSATSQRCLAGIGRALAARSDVLGVTVLAAHDPKAGTDGYARALAAKAALEAGGLPPGRVSAVGLATGGTLEVLVRSGAGPAGPAQIALAEGAEGLPAAGSSLSPGAALRVPGPARVVVAFARGGELELAGGSEGRMIGPEELELAAGSAVLRGAAAALRTPIGTVRTDGAAEVVLRNGGLAVASVRGTTRLQQVEVPEGQGIWVAPGGEVDGPALLLPAPARAPIDASGSGPAAAGFGPVDGAHHYEVASAADADFRTQLQVAGFAPDASAAPPGTGPRFVRVRAVSEQGIPGRWSQVRRFE